MELTEKEKEEIKKCSKEIKEEREKYPHRRLIPQLIAWANDYDRAQYFLNKWEKNEQVEGASDFVLEKAEAQQNIISTLKSLDDKARDDILCQVDWIYRSQVNTDEYEKPLEQGGYVNFNPKRDGCHRVFDLYFKNLAREKIANAVKVFDAENNEEFGEAMYAIKKDVEKTTAIEKVFIRPFLSDIKEKASKKTENTKSKTVLKQCTQIIASEGILQDFIEQALDINTQKSETEKEM